MKLLKPNWVNHDGQDIFSIDIHPDGSRFATGGQGKDSGKIIIWNMGPVIDKKQENDENSPRVLCQMEHHIACVNIVRWSNKGLFLASGSDDKLVMIWQYANGNNFQNIENWKCGYTLRAHNGDVLDLAWSNNDEYLATCSVDNTIIIWNALKFPDIIQRINAHASLVKGVAWDPVGAYLSSQSDDKTVKVWSTFDWSQVKVVSEPFRNSTGTTHILRLNWSPDGQLLIATHAVNNGVPTAQIINRANDWNTKIDFVGHRKAVMVSRFYPQILKPSNESINDFKVYCLLALGSRDRSVSIWTTNLSRPLCVIQDLFDNPIMDLSWSKQPRPGLLACSTDGTVAYLEFDYDEIGYPLSKLETEEFFMKKYNHDLKAVKENFQKRASEISSDKIRDKSKKDEFIESFDALMAHEQIEQQQKYGDTKSSENNNNNNNNPFNLSVINENSNSLMSNRIYAITDNQKQIERRMADGRRRITPVCVSKPGEYDAPKPFGQTAISTVPMIEGSNFSHSIGFGNSNSCTETAVAYSSTSYVIEKRNEKNETMQVSPAKTLPATSTSTTNSTDKPSAQITNSISSISLTIEQNDESSATRANDESNIIDNQTETTVTATTTTTTTTFQKNVSNIEQKVSQQKSTNNNNKPLKPINPTKSNSSLDVSSTLTKKSESLVAKQTSFNNNNNNNKSIHLARQSSQTTLNQTQNNINNNNNNALGKSESPQKPICSSQNLASQVHALANQQFLDSIKPIKNAFTKITRQEGKEYSIEIHNSISLLESDPTTNRNFVSSDENSHEISLLKFFCDQTFKWQVYLYSRICDISVNKYFVSIICEDQTLNLVKIRHGTHLCSPIVLDSQAASLYSIANYCMCLTVQCSLYVWKYDLSDQESTSHFNLRTLLSQKDCKFIFQNNDSFARAYLTENGIPVIIMNSSNSTRSYHYSFETKCWHLVPHSFDNKSSFASSQILAHSASVFSNSFNSASSFEKSGPLEQIQSKNKSTRLIKTIESLNKIDLNRNNLFNKQDFTLVHLESQVNASLGLNSPKEYKFWLITYARYLVENDYEEKLTELCNALLGPLYSLNWQQNILIHKKRDLLREILPVMAQNLRLQRLHSYYKKQLSLCSASSTNQKASSALDRLAGSFSTAKDTFSKSAISNKNFDFTRPLGTSLSQTQNESMAVEEEPSKENKQSPVAIMPSEEVEKASNSQEMNAD